MTDCLMSAAECDVLFGLVRGLSPRSALEIGSHKGGSAAIIARAIEANGFGTLVCVDPEPLFTADEPRFHGHVTLIAGQSPDVIPDAAKIAGDAWDFVFIDGNHSKQSVLWDFEAVLPYVAWNSHILFHDAHYAPVSEAIASLRETYAARVVDCGLVSIASFKHERDTWGGLYLFKVTL